MDTSAVRFLPATVARILAYAALVLIGAFCVLGVTTDTQAAAPNGFTSRVYSDANGDGTIDRLTVVVNGGEALTACTVSAGELTTDWTYVGGATFGGSLESATCTTGTATIVFVISGATANVTGGGTAPTIAYDNDDGDNSIANASGNLGAVGAGNATDGAAPVIVSVTPTGSSTSRSATPSITFSEAMDTTFAQDTEFTISPNGAGTWTPTWSVSDTVVTLDAPGAMPCATRHTITLALSDIDAATGSVTDLVATGPEDNAFSFSTIACGGNTDGDKEIVRTPQLRLLTPGAATEVEVGGQVSLSWEDVSSNTSIPFVTLSYSVNGGAQQTIVANMPTQRSPYIWTIPNVEGSIVITIRGTDLLDTMYTLTTPALTVMGDEPVAEEPTEEEVIEVPTYRFVRAAGSDAVYAVDQNNVRHPFYNAAIFFTWADSFDEVEEITPAAMGELTMGAPMTPRAGTVLVKIESVAKVYALEADASGQVWLRWITSEEVARELFGANWSDYVIDIPVTLFPRMEMGSDVVASDDLAVVRGELRSRESLYR